MNLKSSLVFFSVGIILILFLFLMGAVPMGMLGTSQQQLQEQQEQNSESNNDMSSKGDDIQGQQQQQQQQLTTTMTTATLEEEEENNVIVPAKTQTKPIDQMDCTELRDFAFSFEEGWGSAVALHDERCS